jgi:lysozyme
MTTERHINEAGLTLVKHFESFSAIPYVCPAGHRTIGYGHVIGPNENFDTITPEMGEHLLQMDLNIAESDVVRLIEVDLSDNQFSALVSFVFNIGGAALQRSTLRKRLNQRDYTGAAEEFPKWCYAGGVKLAGLLRRRIAEQKLFLS